MYTCDACQMNSCYKKEPTGYPKNCPCPDEAHVEACKELYSDPENMMISHNSALVEAEGYLRKNRLEEIMDFARKCNYHKLGVAFCLGMKREGNILCNILRHNGFDVVAVACKHGRIPKEFIGIKDEEKVRPGTFESICNPIGQALLMNQQKTDLNVMMGLCVGHDTLFMKYSEAPATVFAVKDRALAHNPIGALYLSENYYKQKFFGKNQAD
ncbi:DUF1847 domain-containing protein [Papillibacter cinnamivorans]|uniref:Uncharacterized metal-binding protein n=1 Tax=Papillibacter cinnamivorans DSM 12816 TaxID=1122930 RepID=A0A1W2CVJ4_9FIRM|nr:DUF1847 domain-containing protein [Papillibacter cinnamivorans]SMC88872.1 Uncharacterized metal-binding protein [Papillibacter cinnamivorans DSM 12816]